MARGGRPSGSSGSGGAEGSRRRHLASTAGKEPTVAVPLLFDEGAQWWAPEEVSHSRVHLVASCSVVLSERASSYIHLYMYSRERYYRISFHRRTVGLFRLPVSTLTCWQSTTGGGFMCGRGRATPRRREDHTPWRQNWVWLERRFDSLLGKS